MPRADKRGQVKPQDLDSSFEQAHRSARYLRIRTLLYIAKQYMLFKKLRTSLTILGVTIGIGAIVFLVSFSLGLQNLVTKQVIGSKSIQLIDVTTSRPKSVKLNDETIYRIKDLAHVTGVAKSYSFAGRVAVNNATIDSVVYGTDKEYFDLNALSLSAGRNEFKADNEALANTSLLKTIGQADPTKLIDKTLKITIAKPTEEDPKATYTQEVKIVGLVDSGKGVEIYMPDSAFRNVGFTDYAQLKVSVDSTNAIPNVRKQIESFGYITESPSDTLTQINDVFRVFTVILAGFGGIGLIVAVLGMFNTLTISLLERTKEIGLLSALGSRRRDITRIFLTESLILSSIGSITGIFGAWSVGKLIDLLLNAVAHSRGVKENLSVFTMTPTLVISMVVFSCLVAVLVSTYPIIRATRISPIEALRHE